GGCSACLKRNPPTLRPPHRYKNRNKICFYLTAPWLKYGRGVFVISRLLPGPVLHGGCIVFFF
ncbi:MAG: hypothetical protein J6C49_07935, partial [Elusimicrobiaceae bacterium]|nr:hypothetical protein [Elusimicrobiaceae bacterium]